MRKTELEKLRKTLFERRRELAELRNSTLEHEQELLAKTEADWTDAATDVELASVLETLSEVERRELLEIEAALARMDESIYGVCSGCEEEIPVERLKILPATRLCVLCASGRRAA